MINTSEPQKWVPFSVPVKTAQKWITNWINADPSAQPLSPTDMRAFLVRRADFVELLAQDDTEFIRLYVGRKEDIKEDRMRPCLLMVSAAYQGDIDPSAPDPSLIVDLIGPMTVTKGFVQQEETYEVFDFSQPCPPHCNPESELFIGPADETCS